MPTFTTLLVPGTEPPYDSWTFVVVPEIVMSELGKSRARVRGTIAGVSFRATVAKGEGVHRMPLPSALRSEAGIARGDEVEVVMELDPEPYRVEIPKELDEILTADPDLARQFDSLAPSCRRAWAAHVGEAKRAETRVRRAAKAPEGIRRKVFPGQ